MWRDETGITRENIWDKYEKKTLNTEKTKYFQDTIFATIWIWIWLVVVYHKLVLRIEYSMSLTENPFEGGMLPLTFRFKDVEKQKEPFQ